MKDPYIPDADWTLISEARSEPVIAVRSNSESGFFKIRRSANGWTAEFCRNFDVLPLAPWRRSPKTTYYPS